MESNSLQNVVHRLVAPTTSRPLPRLPPPCSSLAHNNNTQHTNNLSMFNQRRNVRFWIEAYELVCVLQLWMGGKPLDIGKQQGGNQHFLDSTYHILICNTWQHMSHSDM